jgi:hypothetical protein
MSDVTPSKPSDTSTPHALVFSSPGPLSQETLNHLQTNFGLQLKSSSAAVGQQLGRIGDVAVVFFDKSSPGFDKVFDKTSPDIGGIDVINPADLHARVSVLENHVAQLRATGGQPGGG